MQYEDKTDLLLIALYEAWNKPEEAVKWQSKLQQTVTVKE
jgi:hypothetical protein